MWNRPTPPSNWPCGNIRITAPKRLVWFCFFFFLNDCARETERNSPPKIVWNSAMWSSTQKYSRAARSPGKVQKICSWWNWRNCLPTDLALDKARMNLVNWCFPIGINSLTMVIHFQDTCAAHTAMMRSIRFDYKTFLTVSEGAGDRPGKVHTEKGQKWRNGRRIGHIETYRLLMGRSFAKTSRIRRWVSWLSARARRSISLFGTRNCGKQRSMVD